ncbi:MAG TPA: hypothetical protein VGF67_02670, partial [Ktedonobacteraceae bacterium]
MAQRGPETTFYRPVRNYPAQLPQETLQLQPPPQLPQKQSGAMALVQLLYPLGGILMTIVMITSTRTLSGHDPLTIGAEVCIVPISLGAMFFSNFLQRRAGKQAHKAEKQRYKGYLENIERRLREMVKLQSQYATRLHPDPQQLPRLAAERQVLWERRPGDDDFLHIRVGLAPTALHCQITLQEDFRAAYTLDLLQEARDLITSYGHIDAQPLVIALGQQGTVSVTGPRQAVTGLVRAVLAQIITFHAASEVRIVGYFPPQAAAEWSWLKWAPHTRCLRPVKVQQPAEPEHYSMLADTTEDLQFLLETQIGPELEQRHKYLEDKRASGAGQEQAQLRARVPHLLLVLDHYSHAGPLARVPGLETLMGEGAVLGITVLCLCPSQEHEPSLTRARLSLAPFIGHYQLAYKETSPGGRELEFIQADHLDVQPCETLGRGQTPLLLVDREAEIDFSASIGLLDLHQVPDLA